MLVSVIVVAASFRAGPENNAGVKRSARTFDTKSTQEWCPALHGGAGPSCDGFHPWSLCVCAPPSSRPRLEQHVSARRESTLARVAFTHDPPLGTGVRRGPFDGSISGAGRSRLERGCCAGGIAVPEPSDSQTFMSHEGRRSGACFSGNESSESTKANVGLSDWIACVGPRRYRTSYILCFGGRWLWPHS